MTVGFIIPTCVKSDIHFNQLKRCINSIREFHENIKIILIDDSDDEYKIQTIQYFESDDNIYIKNSLIRGSADQQCFKILLQTELFEKAIFMQDSMLLLKPIDNIDNIELIFIWHFTNHRIHWDKIREPNSIYNTKQNIRNHTDLVANNVRRDFNENKEFQNYALHMLKNKHLWCGCFGSLCIINKNTISFLNDKTSFVDKFVNATSNRDRRANETIFSLICHFKYPNRDFEKSYDHLYYDGYVYGGNSDMVGRDTGFDNLKWCAFHEYFSKISFNR